MADKGMVGASERLDMPFVGIPSFLRAPIHTDLDSLDADIAVLGAPTDEGSPFKPGSRFGARAMREHSLRFVSGKGGYYDPQRGRRFLEREMNGAIVDVGDADILPTNLPGTFDNITASTRGILAAGAMPVVLGGDHAITFPVVRAFTGPLHVLHLDAHLDYMPFVPGCVSAEPDGMSYRELRDLLAAIAEQTEVVGFDLVEVNPLLDVATGVTAYLGAHIVLEFLGRICEQPRWIKKFDERVARRAR